MKPTDSTADGFLFVVQEFAAVFNGFGTAPRPLTHCKRERAPSNQLTLASDVHKCGVDESTTVTSSSNPTNSAF